MSRPLVLDIYCRLSEDRDGKLVAVTRQEADNRALFERIQQTRDVVLGEVLVDNDLSAWRRDVRRPGWEALLDRLSSNESDGVITYHGDRLIRQPRDLEKLLDAADHGKLIISPSGERDLSNPDHRYILRIEVAGACRESDNTSRRVTRANRATAEGGKPSGGGLRPFGYEKDRVTIREDEAAIIRDLAERFLAGEALAALAKEMTARAVPTPQGARYWHPATLRAILRSGRVAGWREYKGQVVARATWPPILDEETWQAVRAVLATRSHAHDTRKRTYLLTSLLRCSLCGAALMGSNTGKPARRTYYCIPGRGGCGKIRITARFVDVLVSEAVVGWLRTPGRVQQLAAASSDRAAAKMAEAQKETVLAEAQLQELAAMWGAGDITTEEYKAARVPLTKRLDAARDSAPRVARVSASLLGAAGSAADQAWERLDLEERRRIIAAVVESIVVRPSTANRFKGFEPERVEIRMR